MLEQTILKLLLVATLTPTVCRADPGRFHSFTYQNDKSITAQIMNVDQVKRAVLLEREDHASAWVKVDALSPEDLQHILAWHKSFRLMEPDHLKVSVKQERQYARVNKQDDLMHRETYYLPVITLENRAGETIENLSIDYCYYIVENGPGKSPSQSRLELGSISVGSMTDGQVSVLKTDEFVLLSKFTMQQESGMFGTTMSEHVKSAEEVMGVWLRVYGSCANGVAAVREICDPADLCERVSWSSANLLSQTNASD